MPLTVLEGMIRIPAQIRHCLKEAIPGQLAVSIIDRGGTILCRLCLLCSLPTHRAQWGKLQLLLIDQGASLEAKGNNLS